MADAPEADVEEEKPLDPVEARKAREKEGEFCSAQASISTNCPQFFSSATNFRKAFFPGIKRPRKMKCR